MARVHRGEEVQQLCLVCVHGQEYVDKLEQETNDWLRSYWIGDASKKAQYEQLPLQLELEEPITLVRTNVYVVNITPELLKVLSTNPDEICSLTPEMFEQLICDRLQHMGFSVTRVGAHSLQKDGGIDIVACPRKTPFPFLVAIQAKHHRSSERKTGPSPVRDLLGVLQTHPFNAGVLVTNTTFTPDAIWMAKQQPMLVSLRDIYDLRRWLADNFLDESNWSEVPDELVVCPGVVVKLSGLKC